MILICLRHKTIILGCSAKDSALPVLAISFIIRLGMVAVKVVFVFSWYFLSVSIFVCNVSQFELLIKKYFSAIPSLLVALHEYFPNLLRWFSRTSSLL